MLSEFLQNLNFINSQCLVSIGKDAGIKILGAKQIHKVPAEVKFDTKSGAAAQ